MMSDGSDDDHAHGSSVTPISENLRNAAVDVPLESPQPPAEPVALAAAAAARDEEPVAALPARSPAARTVSSTRVEPSAQDTAAPAAARRLSTSEEQEPDSTGLGTVQSGLWGLWSTVSNAGVVKAAVSSARTMTDKAVAHVQQRGIMQAAVDGAQAAVESAKRVDNAYLQGTLTKIVDTTVTAAHRGMDVVSEHLPHHGEHKPAAINVVLTSSKFEKVNAVRVALQGRYEGDVGLRALSAESNIAPQPVGFAATRRGAFSRIESLRVQNAIRPNEIIISIENGLVEVFPDHWMDVAVVVLRDDANNITVETVSQSVPAPIEHVRAAMAATPVDFVHRETGWAVTVGQLVKRANPNVNDADWAPLVCGVSRQSQLHFALVVLLGQYSAALRAAATATAHAPSTAAASSASSPS